MNNSRSIIIAVVVLLVVLGGGFWFLNNQKVSAPTTQNEMTDNPSATQDSTLQVTSSPSTDEAGMAVKEIVVENKGLSFNPSTLTLKKGETVKITFKSTGGTHDFRIDEYNVGTKLVQSGQEDSFEFTPDKEGTFEYFCSVPGHRQAGMKGTITVE